MLVAQHLNFNVARIDDELFDEHAVIAKGALRFRLRAGKSFRHLIARPGDAHALAATAGRGLQHDRIADLVGNAHRMVSILDHAEEARHGRDLCRIGEFLRFDLVAHGSNGAGVGADEDDAGILQRIGKGLALGQKAIARMHGLSACLATGLDDALDDEIGFGGRRRADMDGLIGHVHMQRVLVRIGIDGHSLDAHAARGLDDPAGNLATVGDQNLLEHAHPSRKRGATRHPSSVGCLGEQSCPVHSPKDEPQAASQAGIAPQRTSSRATQLRDARLRTSPRNHSGT